MSELKEETNYPIAKVEMAPPPDDAFTAANFAALVRRVKAMEDKDKAPVQSAPPPKPTPAPAPPPKDEDKKP